MARDDDEAPRVSRFSRSVGSRARPNKLVAFPGAPGEKVRLWAPSDEDDQLAETEARRHLTGVLKLSALELSLAADGALFRAELDRQLLFRVLRDPDDPIQSYFESVDEVREGLEAAQREALMREIRHWRTERYPELDLEDVPEAQRGGPGLVGWMREAKSCGALLTWWRSFEPATQDAIMLSLVDASTSATVPSSSDT
ncbi:MAG: hypothetical protein Q8S73_36925 [Deltaproteobacteria bacterium]|nr:hypothetical protein [Myxococcales bacterium]MDP3219744.1 hypothetical protein [Deltaproteobacteria bacterium]